VGARGCDQSASISRQRRNTKSKDLNPTSLDRLDLGFRLDFRNPDFIIKSS